MEASRASCTLNKITPNKQHGGGGYNIEYQSKVWTHPIHLMLMTTGQKELRMNKEHTWNYAGDKFLNYLN